MAITPLVGAGSGGYDTEGHINESVLQNIYDLSKRPLPFQDRIGTGSHGREKHEWLMRRLAKGVITNAVVDGSDPSSDQTKIGKRVSNHSQESIKVVSVSDRVRNSDSIGVGDELQRQIVDRAWELRYDIEAAALSNNASVADDGSSTAGQSGGLCAWAKAEDVDTNASSHVVSIGTGGSFADGGYNYSTNVVDKTTFNTTNTALAQADIDGVILALWKLNVSPTLAMGPGSVVQKISQYFVNQGASQLSSNFQTNVANTPTDLVAQANVNIYRTHFGRTLMIEANPHMPNRVDTTMTDGTTDTDVLYIMDPSYLEISYLRPRYTKYLAVTGLSQDVMHVADWTLVVKNHEAVGMIAGILDTSAVTAS